MVSQLTDLLTGTQNFGTVVIWLFAHCYLNWKCLGT